MGFASSALVACLLAQPLVDGFESSALTPPWTDSLIDGLNELTIASEAARTGDGGLRVVFAGDSVANHSSVRYEPDGGLTATYVDFWFRLVTPLSDFPLTGAGDFSLVRVGDALVSNMVLCRLGLATARASSSHFATRTRRVWA